MWFVQSNIQQLYESKLMAIVLAIKNLMPHLLSRSLKFLLKQRIGRIPKIGCKIVNIWVWHTIQATEGEVENIGGRCFTSNTTSSWTMFPNNNIEFTITNRQVEENDHLSRVKVALLLERRNRRNGERLLTFQWNLILRYKVCIVIPSTYRIPLLLQELHPVLLQVNQEGWKHITIDL